MENTKHNVPPLKLDFNVKEVHDKIIDFIHMFFSDKEGPAVVGISGGKDSTICAALLAEALGPERVIGVMMPNGKQADIADSHQVIEMLGIQAMKVNIGPVYDALKTQIDTSGIKDSPDQWLPLFTTNTPARLRMVTLYGIAAQLGGFVVNTCNLSESIVGWETYGGDGFGDFAPIGRLTKTEVCFLGDYMELPKYLIYKIPSDGMCGASDEDKMGFTYEALDSYIRNGIVPKEKDKILSMHKRSHFKHENIRIPTCKIDLPIYKDFDWD